MNWDRLRCVTPPAVSPLSLDEAKAHLEVDSIYRDELIQASIDAAVGDVDGPHGIGIAMIRQTWKLTLDRFDCRMTIPLTPVISIDAVEYVDATGEVVELASDRYHFAADLDPPLLTPAFGTLFPLTRCEPGAVRITFTAGFGEAAGDVPKDLVQALKLIVAARFEDRTNGDVPAAARAILNRYAALAVA